MPRTDDNVTFVQNGRLACGDTESGLVEPEAEPVVGRLDVGRDGRRAVAQLGVAPGDPCEEAPGGAHLAPGKRGQRADHDGVRLRIAPEREGGLSGRYAEPSSLARSKAPEAVVRPERLSRLVDDAPLTAVQAVPLEEVTVVPAAQEARLLALGAACHGQAGAPSGNQIRSR